MCCCRHPLPALRADLSHCVGEVYAYRPLNTGARFSTNARAASLWSSLARERSIPFASLSNPAASVLLSATFSLEQRMCLA